MNTLLSLSTEAAGSPDHHGENVPQYFKILLPSNVDLVGKTRVRTVEGKHFLELAWV